MKKYPSVTEIEIYVSVALLFKMQEMKRGILTTTQVMLNNSINVTVLAESCSDIYFILLRNYSKHNCHGARAISYSLKEKSPVGEVSMLKAIIDCL